MDKRVDQLKEGDVFYHFGKEHVVLKTSIWHRNSKKEDSVYAIKTNKRTLHFYGFNKVEIE